MDRGDEVRAPATTRLRPSGGSDHRLRVAVGLVVAAVALAVLKPWNLVPPPTVSGDDAPSPAARSSAGPSPGATSIPASAQWIAIGDRPACFAGRTWMAVVDEVDGGRLARSWTSLAPVPVAGPTDPAIARTHTYADAVPRIGFCAPAPAGAPTLAAGGNALDVALWRLEPGGGSVEAAAREVHWRLVGGGTGTDGGALYVPAGEPQLRRGPPDARGWPPGTYVFRVRLAGADPGSPDETWFAVELRGPWRRPGAPVPSPAVPGGPGVPTPTPATVPDPG